MAACFGLLCKMLDGNCVRPVLEMCPEFGIDTSVLDPSHGYNTSYQDDLQRNMGLVRVTNLKDTFRKVSLKSFERSFICKVYDLFNMIPQHLKVKGLKESWSLVMKDGQRFISSM